MRQLLIVFLFVSCFAPGASPQSYAIKPQVSDGIQFVSPNGTDSNDGLSYGSAKLTISAAYSALPSSGGTINVSGSGVSWPNLTGASAASLNHLRIECDPNTSITVARNMSVRLTGSYQTIDDCYFTGPGTTTSTSAPILLEGSWQTVIRDTFSAFDASTGEVYLNGATHAIISHNRFFNNVTDEVFGENNTTHVVVADNTMDGSNHASSSHNIAFHSTTPSEVVSDISIIGNDIIGAGDYCVEVGGFNGNTATNISITGNTCKLGAAGVGGYSVGSAVTNFTISGNTYNSNGYATSIGGIEAASGATQGTISGNSIYFGNASSGSPISISTTYGSVSDVEVVGNSATFSWTANFPSRGACLVATDSAAYVLERISFVGNLCNMSGSTGTGSQATQGVWLQCNHSSAICTDLVVADNILLGANLSGDVPIDVERDHGTMNGIRINGNDLTNWSHGIFATANMISPSQSAMLGQVSAGYRAAALTLSSGSATFTFPNAYASVPVCTLGPTTTAFSYQVAPTTTSATVASSSRSDVAKIYIICVGDPN